MSVSPYSLSSLAAAAVLATGCASFNPGTVPPGLSLETARARLSPTEEFALPNGGTRLEFTRGRETYMLDFGSDSKLVSNEQVLNDASFSRIQPGMPRDEVLRELGRPAFTIGVGWQHLSVMNYRFGGADGDCVVFQVSIDNSSQTVSNAARGTDPACDAGKRD